ncbi:unnamed protein product, partial [Nesidiocoris tenuis]
MHEPLSTSHSIVGSEWVEESFTNFEKGINWRSYVVCDVAYNSVNNWLWTPFIERGDANRIYIEIKFTIRDCSLFPGNALSCKETFSLLYYEFDAATREPPPWEPETYKLIVNSRELGSNCGKFERSLITTPRVYYLTCPEVTANFAKFPSTPTGKEVTLIEQATGRCVDNAEEVETPTYLCKGDGKWYLPTGGCKCKPGFEADVEKQTCNVTSVHGLAAVSFRRKPFSSRINTESLMENCALLASTSMRPALTTANHAHCIARHRITASLNAGATQDTTVPMKIPRACHAH